MPTIKQMVLEDADGPEWESMIALMDENKEYLMSNANVLVKAVMNGDKGLILTGLSTMLYEAFRAGRQSVLDEQEKMK